MTPDELRLKYLNFFKKKNHAIIPSAPLIPENDPTTLFTGSGMQPMVPYLLGTKHPLGTRLVDSQKCFRSQDIEEVGDNRHTTFFEMLGNWSLGDYFKKEQLEWIWEFLVDEVGIKPDKLLVTCFGGDKIAGIDKDTEAEKIWLKIFKKYQLDPQGKISFTLNNENWWSRAGAPATMPLGEPGGPDSEIFYDFGEELKLHEKSKFKKEKCQVNCDCGRYLEIGNSVFMTFFKTQSGFEELKNKNIDFGGGFERILSVIDNQQDVFKTNLFRPIIIQLEKLSHQKYTSNKKAFRIIADHVKAATFLAVDGVFPGNKAQDYFSRRLLRRAIRYGKEIGIKQNFISKLVPIVAKIYTKPYPEINNKIIKIENIFNDEENKFNKTLEKGLKELYRMWDKRAVKTHWTSDLKKTTQEAFYFYQTYGFPPDIYWEEAEKKFGLPSSQDINKQKFISEFNLLRQDHSAQSKIASAGMFQGGLAEHSETTTKYHTATHLLQAALRQILGPHIEQKGSNITAERLRFDFSFDRALTSKEKTEIENQINIWIEKNQPISKTTMDKNQALSQGVLAFFADKYPDQATVYSIGQPSSYISRELCGGPHVESTAQIGPIKIQKEKSAAAGVRRIYIKLAVK